MQAQTLRRRFADAERHWEHIDTIVGENGLPERLGAALFDALLGLRVTRSSYLKHTALDERTATRDLVRAADLGLLGTPTRNLQAIQAGGLRKQGRHAVHLSADAETAHHVGARRGAHVVLEVDAAAMHRDGHRLAVLPNGVWLTESVPARYLNAPTAATE